MNYYCATMRTAAVDVSLVQRTISCWELVIRNDKINRNAKEIGFDVVPQRLPNIQMPRCKYSTRSLASKLTDENRESSADRLVFKSYIRTSII